jgi:hypothetical protein
MPVQETDTMRSKGRGGEITNARNATAEKKKEK